jgi:ribosomal protein S18 acetylase RimI-like enzyme
VSSPAAAPSPPNPRPSEHRLDRAIWHALTGLHASVAHLGVGGDGQVLAARYDPEVSPFAAVGEIEEPAGWAALATVVDIGAMAVVMVPFEAPDRIHPWPPAGWKSVMDLPGVQMVAADMKPEADPGTLVLGPADVTEMLDLVARTRPGPFARRTIELGGYIGFRAEPDQRPDGRLVAMAGRRFAPGGFVEISAVCTDADQRGKGLGGRLVRAVAAGIVAEGAVPFLHAAATNPAIALYEELGMVVRRQVRFIALERMA